jgi:hypothetical protein
MVAEKVGCLLVVTRFEQFKNCQMLLVAVETRLVDLEIVLDQAAQAIDMLNSLGEESVSGTGDDLFVKSGTDFEYFRKYRGIGLGLRHLFQLLPEFSEQNVIYFVGRF